MTQTTEGLRVIRQALQTPDDGKAAICMQPLRQPRSDPVLDTIASRMQGSGFTLSEVGEAAATIDHVNELLGDSSRGLISQAVDDVEWLDEIHPDAVRNLGSLSIAYERSRDKGLLKDLEINGSELTEIVLADTLACGALMKWRPKQQKRPDLAVYMGTDQIAMLLASYPKVPLDKARRVLHRLRGHSVRFGPIFDILTNFPEMYADDAIKQYNRNKTYNAGIVVW